jgi:hypothetical protein
LETKAEEGGFCVTRICFKRVFVLFPGKRFTPKPIKNKNQKLKQVKLFMNEKRGILELESVTSFDLNFL